MEASIHACETNPPFEDAAATQLSVSQIYEETYDWVEVEAHGLACMLGSWASSEGTMASQSAHVQSSIEKEKCDLAIEDLQIKVKIDQHSSEALKRVSDDVPQSIDDYDTVVSARQIALEIDCEVIDEVPEKSR